MVVKSKEYWFPKPTKGHLNQHIVIFYMFDPRWDFH